MQLPALQIQQPDIGNALYKAAIIKSSGVRNKLLEAKLAREGKIADLTGDAMGEMTGPRNALAARAADPGMGTDPDAMGAMPGSQPDGIPQSLRDLAAIAPDRAKQVVDLVKTMDDRQKAQVAETTAKVAKLAIGVLDAPDEQKPAAYQQALQIAGQQGMAVDTMPPEYGPEAEQKLNTVVLEALTLDDIMAMRKPSEGFRRTGDGLEPIPGGPKDPKYIGEVEAAKAGGGKDTANIREANWLVEKGIAKDLDAAYRMTRERVRMSPQEIRTKGLAWIAQQKDRAGRQVYNTPEKQAAALAAYEKWIAGDNDGALAALKALQPKKEETDEAGLLEGLWRSFGGGDGKGAAKPAETPKPKPAPKAETPDAQRTLQQARDAIAKGADRAKVEERLRKLGIDPKGL